VDETYEIAFLIGSETPDYGGPPTLRLSAHPVKWMPDGAIRNFNGVGFDSEPLADLQVNALCDRTANADSYGWSVEYRNVFSVDLRRAAEMVKVLRKVESGLARIQTELGYPETFPAYLARVAKVLGIKQFGWKLSGRAAEYSGNEYRFTDPAGMTSYVTELCRKFLEPEQVA
jgi:hypothetical protein